MPLFALGTALLVLLDIYVSKKRLERYGPRVELNPLARQLAADHGTNAALLFLGVYNLGLLALCLCYPTALHILFGAKLGLGLMQLKSLELETFVETLLRKAKEKKNESQ